MLWWTFAFLMRVLVLPAARVHRLPCACPPPRPFVWAVVEHQYDTARHILTLPYIIYLPHRRFRLITTLTVLNATVGDDVTMYPVPLLSP